MSNASDLIKYHKNGFAEAAKCLRDKGLITIFGYVPDYVS